MTDGRLHDFCCVRKSVAHVHGADARACDFAVSEIKKKQSLNLVAAKKKPRENRPSKYSSLTEN